MKNFLLIAIVLCATSYSRAQQGPPTFKPGPITIEVPGFLPGIMSDTMGITRNDTLIYHLLGQVFGKGHYVSLDNRSYGNTSPWELLYTLANAYASKNPEKILSLYHTASRDRVRSIVYGPQSAAFLNYVSTAAKARLRILGGFDYADGFIAYVKDDRSGVHRNYMLREDGHYRLAAFEDVRATSQNIEISFKLAEGRMMAVEINGLPDSLKMGDSVLVHLRLPKGNSWAAIYTPNASETVDLLIEDNGMNDMDPVSGQLSFLLQSSIFSAPGMQDYYITSANYPMLKVSPGFMSEKARHRIMVME